MEGTNKRKLSIMLVVILLMQIILPVLTIIIESDFTIKSTATDNSWNLGDGITATLEDGVLKVKGEGAIKARSSDGVGPWTGSKANEINEVIIEDGITGIGINNFNQLKQLKKVTIGKDVQYINNHCFKGCDKLEEINFNEGLKYIYEVCFTDCAITDIVFPLTLLQIGYLSFNDCKKLETRTYLNHNMYVDTKAFDNCSNLKYTYYSYRSKDGKWIYDISNVGAQNLRPNWTKKDNLVIVNIPATLGNLTVRSIGNNAFSNYKKIERITIPENVINIGQNAFKDCDNLRWVYFYGNINNIGKNTFKGCKSLKKVYFYGKDLNSCHGAFLEPITCCVHRGSNTEKTLKWYNNIKFEYFNDTQITATAIIQQDEYTMIKIEISGGKCITNYNYGVITKDETPSFSRISWPKNEAIVTINHKFETADILKRHLVVKVWYENGETEEKYFTAQDLGITESTKNDNYKITKKNNPTIYTSENGGYILVNVSDLATINSELYTLEYSFDEKNWSDYELIIIYMGEEYTPTKEIYIRKKDEDNKEKWESIIINISEEDWEKSKKETSEKTPEEKTEDDTEKPYIDSLRIVDGTGTIIFEEEKWYKKGTTLLVDGADKVSEDRVQYSFNGGNYSDENKYQMTKTEDIKIKVKDEAKNESEEETIHIQVDAEAPKLSYELSNNENKTKAKIELTASDDESGLAEHIKIFRDTDIIFEDDYSKNNITWNHETGKITIEDITENYEYWVFVYDKVGNCAREIIYVGEEYIDKKEPDISSVSGINSNVKWVNKEEKIVVNASDWTGTSLSQEGLKYCFDYNEETQEGTWQSEASIKFEEIEKKGQKKIIIAVKDNAGNIAVYKDEDGKTLEFNAPGLDKTAPEINIAGNPENWTNEDVTITIKASDSESGLAEVIEILKNGDEIGEDDYNNNNIEWNSETGILTISKITENAIWDVCVYDNVGNKKGETISITKIDKIAPEITKCPETAKTGEKIEVEATDSESGIAGYNFEGETWKTENTYTYETAGTYTIKVKDNAGNITTRTIKIEDESTDPSEPDKPTDPSEPDKPTDPSEPDKPTDPSEPDKPIDPSEPDKPTDPSEPDKPTDPTDPEKLEVSTTIYKISETYIQEIQPETTLQTIIKDIETNENATIEIYDKKGNKITDFKQTAGTGMKIKITLGNESKEYEIVVRGDVDGDGETNLDDMFEINKHRLGKITLTGAKLKASDVNGDGKSDLDDMFKINKYRLGKINKI